MKRTFVSILFIMIVSLLMAQSVTIIPTSRIEERNGKQYYVHIVEKGHTVYSIAKAYEVSVDEIYFENPFTRNGININQELFIPTVNKESEIRQEIREANFEFFYHVCIENETFADISEIYLQPERNIRLANPTSTPPFREGEYLKIPVEIPESVMRAEFPPEAKKVTRTQTKLRPVKKANTVSFNPNIPVLTDYRHVVIAGETTFGIANKYQVNLNDLKAVNPGLGDFVEKGERLRIPSTASFKQNDSKERLKANNKPEVIEQTEVVKVTESPIMPGNEPQDEGFVVHTVKKKETVYRISRNYGVTIQELYDANPGLTDKLRIGQEIKIKKKKITNNYIIHDVIAKTRFKKIAKLYGLSETALAKKNPGVGKYVYRGQEVKIPVGNKVYLIAVEKPVEEPDKPINNGTVVSDKETLPNGPCKKEPTASSSEIRIALMVPLFLEELQEIEKVDEVLRGNPKGFQPFTFVNFVEGAMMAVDSLRKIGFNVKLKVYDVDKSLTKTTKVLQNPELKDVDLIIGPFYNQSFHQVALFAGNFGIPIVNPLTYRERILKEYKTAIKIMPTEDSQIPLLKEIIRQYYPNSKVFLITQNSYKDADKVIVVENALREVVNPFAMISNLDLYNYSTLVAYRAEEWLEGDLLPVYQMEGKSIDPEYMNENLADSTYFDNSLIRINYMPAGFDAFMSKASALRGNVVVLYASDKRDKAFVMDVMNKLNEFRDSLNISLIGLSLWESFENIDMIQMNNLNTINFESSHIDYDADEIQDFIYGFRQLYSTDPGKYGFAGYDITWFFGNALYYYGKNFSECLPQFETQSFSVNMWFRKAYLDNSSFENTHWNIVKYKNLQKSKLYLGL